MARCSSGSARASHNVVRVARRGVLKVRGRNLRKVDQVIFLGGPGRSDDVKASPSAIGLMSVDVEVSGGAVSGPIQLVADEAASPPSLQRLFVLDPDDDEDEDRGDRDDDDDDRGNGGGNDSNGGGNQGSGPVAGQSLIWPVPRGPIYGAFGENRGSHVHAGIDISAPVTTPIKAAAGGRVLFAAASGAYGNYICVAHKAVSTCYAHLATMTVVAGGAVSRGQLIGTVGMTGNSSGPHLHFEVRQGTAMYGTPLDPSPYLPGGVPRATRTGTSGLLDLAKRHPLD